MSYEIDADYSEVYMFPPSVEEWVPDGHPARFVRELVEELDLKSLGFKARQVRNGRPNYSKALLLKVWLYGYFVGIRTSRQLERMCRDHVAAIWLTGRQVPDHNTLWRFFKDNKGRLAEVHKKTVQVALSCQMVGVVLHAIDGTKLGARSSIRGCLKRADLEGALKHLDEHIDELMTEIQTEERYDLDISDELPEELIDAKKRRSKVKEALEELDRIGRNTFHPEEKEARIVGREKQLGYNAQAVVDEESGLIVAQDVTNAESDVGQLVEMIEQVEESVGVVAEETVADGGYLSEAELAKAEEKNYPVSVNLGEKKPTGKHDLTAPRFKHDPKRDVVHCPEQAKELRFERTGKRKNGTEVRIYRCHYKECPLLEHCTNDKRGRSVEVGPHRAALDRQREKQTDRVVQERLRKRGSIVERVFGHVKECMNFRRFTVRGLAGARAQWSLIATAHNMKVMYKHWVARMSAKVLGA